MQHDRIDRPIDIGSKSLDGTMAMERVATRFVGVDCMHMVFVPVTIKIVVADRLESVRAREREREGERERTIKELAPCLMRDGSTHQRV